LDHSSREKQIHIERVESETQSYEIRCKTLEDKVRNLEEIKRYSE
jgi:hypothetical protein